MSIVEYKNHLCKDTNVIDERGNVYYEGLAGQGCGTVWFKSVNHANAVIKKFGQVPEVPKELCLKCKSHYSISDPKYKFMFDFNCENWKDDIVKI